MLLRNHSARLITVNGRNAAGVIESFKVLPGDNPATEVPDAYCKSDFVKHLIKIGDLSVMQAEPEDEPVKRVRKPKAEQEDKPEQAE